MILHVWLLDLGEKLWAATFVLFNIVLEHSNHSV